MPTFFGELVKSISAGEIWSGFLLLAVVYLLKKEPFSVFAYFFERREKKLEKALRFLESGGLGAEANDFLKKRVEQELFRYHYGILASETMRSSLLNFYEKNQEKIGWHDIRRASAKISCSGGKLKVTIYWWERPLKWVINLLGGLVSTYALLVVVFAFLSRSENEVQFMLLTLMALILFAMGLFFTSLNWPYESARKIKDTLEGR